MTRTLWSFQSHLKALHLKHWAKLQLGYQDKRLTSTMYQGGRSKSLNLRGRGVWIGGLNSTQGLDYQTLVPRHGSQDAIAGLQGFYIMILHNPPFIITIMMLNVAF